MATDEDEGFHPGTGEYIQIGVILAVLTGIEVSLYFARDAVDQRLSTPILLALTVLKFLLVVLWFMHLRFDSAMFRRLFGAGVVLALFVFSIVGATFYFGPV